MDLRIGDGMGPSTGVGRAVKERSLERNCRSADDASVPRVLSVPVLVILGLASACARGTAPVDRSSFSDAVERTIGAEGFHFESTVRLGETTIHGEGDYVAPDHIAMTSTDGGMPTTTIVVGRMNYVSEREDAHAFSVWEMSCDFELDTFIAALSLIRHAEDVEQDGGSYRFRAEGNERTPIEGEARSENGYLAELVLRYTVPRIGQSVDERWTFSNFGAVAHIEPPPEGQILEHSRVDANPPIVIQAGRPPACP